ncbi:unnamed protein product, partial [Effrenium voratum]
GDVAVFLALRRCWYRRVVQLCRCQHVPGRAGGVEAFPGPGGREYPVPRGGRGGYGGRFRGARRRSHRQPGGGEASLAAASGWPWRLLPCGGTATNWVLLRTLSFPLVSIGAAAGAHRQGALVSHGDLGEGEQGGGSEAADRGGAKEEIQHVTLPQR